jgi:carbamoyltransferase
VPLAAWELRWWCATSFKVRGETIVATPRAAVEASYSTPFDALVIGPYVADKRPA